MLNDIKRATNIPDTIAIGKALPISHARVHNQSKVVDKLNNNIIINFNSIVDHYYDFLEKIIVTITLTDDEFYRYKFQPKRLCDEMYETTELWSLILRINNMTSASQFTRQTVKLFTQDIFDVLEEILILEKEDIEKNHLAIYGE